MLGQNEGKSSLPKDNIEKTEQIRKEIRREKKLISKPISLNNFHSHQNIDV